MKIVCPNCDAEYNIGGELKELSGGYVRCLNCSQEWFQYNFIKSDENENKQKLDLKKLALEEYQFAHSTVQKPSTKKNPYDIDENVRIRVQESSDRLQESKQLTVSNESVPSETLPEPNKWTIIGFVTISLLVSLATSVYHFNLQLQTNFPLWKGFFLEYKSLVKQIIYLIQNFYSDALLFLYQSNQSGIISLSISD